MKLSLYLCTSFFILIQYYGKSFQFNTEDTCPTSRRLLLFGGFQFPLGEKKSEPVSSPETKHSRTHRKDEHAVTIYIQPQTSSELGRKVRSFSHLLKPKLQTAKKEKPKASKTKKTKKKPREISKEKEKKQKKTVETPKTRDLVSVNDQELDRCRALLHLEPSNGLVPVKEKQPKSKKKEKKVRPVKQTPTPSVNKTKKATKSETNEKKKKKSSEKSSVPLTPPKTKVDKKETPSSPPSSPPPPPSTKRESVSVPPAESNPNDLDQDQDHDDHDDNDEKNGTVVGRAYHFMKSMFQLSDDNLESNQTESMIPSMDQTGSKRKLLSFDHLSHISSRHLLSVKSSKKSSAAAAAKPKVGWAYRYRISRYLADQKSRQKRTGGTKQKGKSSSTKGAKRKLLETDEEFWTSDEENVVPMSVSITETFVPKRQLLAATSDDDDDEDNDNDDNGNDDQVKVSKRRRMKSYEELTDPVAIVRYYDQGLFKPRVGWQFRYRVSRYIDSLRENIREDQERLKLGLEAIKRKTPQELSGRRKRVLDKPFKPEAETPAVVQENKPSVGWRYRYRISKMMEAKARGEYVDDSETKRKGKTDQKKTGRDEDDECIEWEFEPDPELRKIGSEGRKVGWDYRYRIRRKLDHLKQKQAETGVPFDWETLSVAGKREKKASTPAAPSAAKEEEKPAETNKKSVGWQYRYRVSKMLEAQKKEATDQTKKKKTAEVPLDARLDPELAKLTPEQRVVGWAYRYRIRRKLDAIKNATKESDAGKRRRKDRDGRKKKEKIIKKVEESIEKILNIEDIDETPFMEYFRRASSYVLFGLVPTARKSVCLLPLPVTLSFCNDDDEPSAETTTTTPPVPITPVKTSSKKEKVKKDRRSSSSRPSKTEPVITSSPSTTTARTSTTTPTTTTTTPTTTSKKAKKKSSNSIRRPSSAGGSRRYIDEQVKHYDEEEEPIRRRIGVPSMKHKTKKKFQILGQEVKVKTKVTTPVTTTTTTTPVPPVQTTTTPAPTAQTTTTTTTTTTPRPVVLTTTSAPTTTTIMTTTTAPPPPPPPPTSPPPTIPEQEASTILSSADASADEANEEMKETVVERPVTPVTNSEEETDTETDDDESGSEETEDDDNKEDTEESNENFDPLALKKMKKLYQTAKESMHGVFDFDDEKDSP